MMEVWKDIQGFDGLYQISNFGNVKSLNYRGTKHEKVLTPKVSNSGRLWVELRKNGNCKQVLIHRLVGKAFIQNPNHFPQINHKDENPKNNNVDNLEWCTGEENRKKYLANHNNGGRKRKNLTPINQIDLDGNVVKQWECSRAISNVTGMNQWSITQCCDGKRKTAYGFRWQYAI